MFAERERENRTTEFRERAGNEIIVEERGGTNQRAAEACAHDRKFGRRESFQLSTSEESLAIVGLQGVLSRVLSYRPQIVYTTCRSFQLWNIFRIAKFFANFRFEGRCFLLSS